MISKRIALVIGLMMDHTFNFYAEINDDGVKLERCYPGAMGDNVYKLRRLHSAHPSNNVCRQLIALVTDNTVIFLLSFLCCIITDSAGNPQQYALVVCYFPPGILPTALPHGNSKDSESPFYPTMPSTLNLKLHNASEMKLSVM